MSDIRKVVKITHKVQLTPLSEQTENYNTVETVYEEVDMPYSFHPPQYPHYNKESNLEKRTKINVQIENYRKYGYQPTNSRLARLLQKVKENEFDRLELLLCMIGIILLNSSKLLILFSIIL